MCNIKSYIIQNHLKEFPETNKQNLFTNDDASTLFIYYILKVFVLFVHSEVLAKLTFYKRKRF